MSKQKRRTGEGKARTQIYIDAEVLREARINTLRREDGSLSAVIETALIQYNNNKERGEGK